jgi:hypothetical protein
MVRPSPRIGRPGGGVINPHANAAPLRGHETKHPGDLHYFNKKGNFD